MKKKFSGPQPITSHTWVSFFYPALDLTVSEEGRKEGSKLGTSTWAGPLTKKNGRVVNTARKERDIAPKVWYMALSILLCFSGRLYCFGPTRPDLVWANALPL